MRVWKIFSLFKWVIFRFHVSFPGCDVLDFWMEETKSPLPLIKCELDYRNISPSFNQIYFLFFDVVQYPKGFTILSVDGS